MNHNIYIDTDTERVYIFHKKPYCILMRHPNTRKFDMYHFEVFEASQYGNEKVYASFSVPRDVFQGCTYETDGQGCDVRVEPMSEQYAFDIRMSNGPNFTMHIDNQWFK